MYRLITTLSSCFMLGFFSSGCGGNQPPGGESVLAAESVYFPLQSGGDTDTVVSEDLTFRVETVVSDVEVVWGIAFLPDGSLLYTERAGSLYQVREGNRVRINGLPDIFVQGQGGLLDVELHPNYKETGWIYLSYSYPGEGGGHTAVMRARLTNDSLTDQDVLFQGISLSNSGAHFGSRIRFDNEGIMFVSTGDRGHMDNAQDLSNHSGKVLRLHDDGSVPADNPFVNNDDAQPEIFTYGNRNIQGMDIHPETGELWSHEHGPRGGDELNVMRAGKNYGWPVISYGINYNGTIITELTEKEGMEQPVLEWTPSIAPSGMAFVTGDRYPAWKGDIMVGALAHQHLQRVVLDGESVVKTERLLEGIGRVREVKMAPDGYLYLAVEHVGILRLIPTD